MCGFIGIYGPDGTDVAAELYEGLLAIQHRGQDAAGITTFTDQFHMKKGFGMVRDVFNQKNMARLRGNLGIGHVRYPTLGGSKREDAQPFLSRIPGVVLCHNGNVTNVPALEAALRDYQSPVPPSVIQSQIALAVAEATDLSFVPERFRPA